VTYEPLLSEALKTDLFPTLNAFIPILQATKVQHCVAEAPPDPANPSIHKCASQVTYDGVHVLAEAVRGLLDPARAAKVGLVDRKGNATYVRNDGTTNPQVKPIELLIDALKGIDAAWDTEIAANHGDTTAHDAWRSARSQLVDTFFSVTGSGAASDWTNPVLPALVPNLIDTLRGHVAAHCPSARFDGSCAWARQELAQKLGDVVDGPTFAAAIDLVDTIRRDDGARLQLEQLVQYLIGQTDPEAQQATVTALHDALQLFDDDANLTPLINALADGVDATLVDDQGHVVRRAAADALVELLTRTLAVARDAKGAEVCTKEIDPDRTLAKVIAKLVTPTAPNAPAPIEVMIDVVADVNRAHPEAAFTTKLAGVDYAKICNEVSDFFENRQSGLEQVYAIIRQATLPQ
jgi:hypothetical protein